MGFRLQTQMQIYGKQQSLCTTLCLRLMPLLLMYYNRVYWTLLRVLLLLFQFQAQVNFNAAMILSEDRLFFISIPIGTNDVRDSPPAWRLGTSIAGFPLSFSMSYQSFWVSNTQVHGGIGIKCLKVR